MLVITLAASAANYSFHLYEAVFLPSRASIAASPTPAGVRLDDRAAVHRYQRIKNLLGEASAYRIAHRMDWAEATLAQVLTLDPAHPIALALTDRLAALPR